MKIIKKNNTKDLQYQKFKMFRFLTLFTQSFIYFYLASFSPGWKKNSALSFELGKKGERQAKEQLHLAAQTKKIVMVSGAQEKFQCYQWM